MMKKVSLLLLLLALFNWSCQDFSFDERLKLPVVEMLPVSVDEDGATFSATIHDISSNFIVRAYFNWYPKGREFFIEDELYREDVVLNDQEEVTLKIDRDLLDGVTYVGRLVIELEDRKVYSNSEEFISQGAKNQPIQYAPPTVPNAVNGDPFLYKGELHRIAFDRISRLSAQNNRWLTVNTNPDRIYQSAFQTQEDRIICTGFSSFSSEENSGIWLCQDFENNCLRISDAPSQLIIRFSFVIDDVCYVNQGSLTYSFNTQNFQGINTLAHLPFATLNQASGVRYYSFSVGGKGYVFIGFEEENDESYPYFQQQLWSFDPASGNWTQLADYPGTGRVHFATSTDGVQFIYVGLGSQSESIVTTVDGDFWRYDVINNQWSFIGYSFERISTRDNWNSGPIGGLLPFLLWFNVNSNSNILNIDPEQITVK
ncbi:MAG: hypothetical protein AAFY48_08530 [Bacteroidota bacterium]